MEEEQKEMATAKPEMLPGPTYMPFLMALSVVFLGWGLISTWLFSVAGLLGMCYSLTGWIKELLHEQRNES